MKSYKLKHDKTSHIAECLATEIKVELRMTRSKQVTNYKSGDYTLIYYNPDRDKIEFGIMPKAGFDDLFEEAPVPVLVDVIVEKFNVQEEVKLVVKKKVSAAVNYKEFE